MKSTLAPIILLSALTACSSREHRLPENDRILAMSFPGLTPSTKNVVRGTGDLSQVGPNDSEESMLTNALLRCGLRQVSWTSYGTDGASRLIAFDDEKTRSAIKCVAKTFPLDFYAVPERASGTDIAVLIQTPR